MWWGTATAVIITCENCCFVDPFAELFRGNSITMEKSTDVVLMWLLGT